jgi:hypothetical protein
MTSTCSIGALTTLNFLIREQNCEAEAHKLNPKYLIP